MRAAKGITWGRTATTSTIAAALALVIAGCATPPPPPELIDARAAYQRAANGPAAKWDPAALHVAQESLRGAEDAYMRDGDAQETRDLAYAAQRKAQLAEAQAQIKVAQQEKAQAQHDVEVTQAQIQKRTQADLASTRQQLQQQQQQYQQTEQQLEAERQRRQEAEKKAQQAAADLAKIAAVKQEPRGMVITLSGSVLFPSAQASLLPQAMIRLNEVADALLKGDPDAHITIEGYADSQGSAQFNQDLSQRRADAVRTYLVSRGVAPDRIDAVGYGPAKPIADNNTAEGRANNRRVEIVVKPSHPSSQGGPGSTGGPSGSGTP